jgi:hypothetical protein
MRERGQLSAGDMYRHETCDEGTATARRRISDGIESSGHRGAAHLWLDDDAGDWPSDVERCSVFVVLGDVVVCGEMSCWMAAESVGAARPVDHVLAGASARIPSQIARSPPMML